MSKKIRSTCFGIFVGIFLISYSIGATYKMSDDEIKNFLKDFQSNTQGIDAVGISIHNTSVALPMFIPGIGIAWGAYIGGSTGAGFGALKAVNSDLLHISPLAFLLTSPFGVMELAAYSIGMSRSFLVILTIIKKNSLKKEIRPSLIEISIVVSLLLVAGFVESIIVNKYI